MQGDSATYFYQVQNDVDLRLQKLETDTDLLSFWLDHDVAVDKDGSDDDHTEERVRQSVECDPPYGMER